MRAATGAKPSARACATEKPVVAKPTPKTPTMDGPTMPAKRSRRARGIGAGHAARFIGGGAERDVGGTSGHQVRDFGAISRGIHAAKTGLHAVVGGDRRRCVRSRHRPRLAISTFGLNPAESTTMSHGHARYAGRARSTSPRSQRNSTPWCFQDFADGVGEIRIVAQQRMRRALDES